MAYSCLTKNRSASTQGEATVIAAIKNLEKRPGQFVVDRLQSRASSAHLPAKCSSLNRLLNRRNPVAVP